MENLEDEARKHFEKLEQSLKYHENRLAQNLPKGIKFQIEREINAIRFVVEYAKEALANRGVRV